MARCATSRGCGGPGAGLEPRCRSTTLGGRADLPRLAAAIGCGGVAVFPDDVVSLDEDGAVLVPAAIVDEVLAEAVEQERVEEWIMGEVQKGVALPGLYPMNEDTRARYRRDTGAP